VRWIKWIKAEAMFVIDIDRTYEKDEGDMKKWEYLEVQPATPFGGGLKAMVVNRRELRNWEQGPDFHEYINQLGAEGWELVTVVQASRLVVMKGKGESYLYVFKREVQ
jgi:hypothetical protein